MYDLSNDYNVDEQGDLTIGMFGAIRKLFDETNDSLRTLDKYLQSQDPPVSGNLYPWNQQIVKGTYRLYCTQHDTWGVTVAYWGDDIDYPILIAGKISFKNGKELYDMLKEVLWNAWFLFGPDDKESDGTIYTYDHNEDDEIVHVSIFAVPLFAVKSKRSLYSYVAKPLNELL